MSYIVYKATNSPEARELYQNLMSGTLDDVVQALGRVGNINYLFFIHQDKLVGQTPLYIAAQEGRVDVINFLLNQGAAMQPIVEAHGAKLSTPLHAAAKKGHIAAVQVLLQTPFNDLQTGDQRGRIPIDLARKYGHDEVAKLLIAHMVEPPSPKHEFPAQHPIQKRRADLRRVAPMLAHMPVAKKNDGSETADRLAAQLKLLNLLSRDA